MFSILTVPKSGRRTPFTALKGNGDHELEPKDGERPAVDNQCACIHADEDGGKAFGWLERFGRRWAVAYFEKGALHHSRGQSTSLHSHYAWKLHVGLDAPVWVETENGSIGLEAGARVIVVPPGVEHRTGAVGWSLAVFLAPGSRGLPWRNSTGTFAMTGAAAARLVTTCRAFDVTEREATPDFAAQVADAVRGQVGNAAGVDGRVEAALDRLQQAPEITLPSLARSVGLSLDRLSRLMGQETGLCLRRHVLWNRVIGFLSSSGEYNTLSAAAVSAGFSDHAHMTRSCRQFLGRAPSEFRSPPDAINRW